MDRLAYVDPCVVGLLVTNEHHPLTTLGCRWIFWRIGREGMQPPSVPNPRRQLRRPADALGRRIWVYGVRGGRELDLGPDEVALLF